MAQPLSVAELDQLLAVTETLIMRLQNSIEETTAVARSIAAMRDEAMGL